MSKKEKMICKPVGNRKKRKWVSLFVTLATILLIAVLINMAVIFFFSSESKEESGTRSTGIVKKLTYLLYPDYDSYDWDTQMELMASTHHAVRKLAHFSEFGLLGFLITALILYINRRKHWIKLWLEWVIPMAFCLLYAISDEVHQIFSERGPSVKDVLIDFAGSVTGILLMHAIAAIVRTVKRRRERRKCKTPATS